MEVFCITFIILKLRYGIQLCVNCTNLVLTESLVHTCMDAV